MARGAGVALVGGLLGSVVGWLGQLLLARLLGPGGFGSYSIGLAMVGIASQLSTMGLSSAVIYFVSRYAQDEGGKARDVLVQSIGTSLFAGLMVGFVLFLLSPSLATHFFHRPDLARVLRIFALAIGFASSFKVATAAITVSYKLSYRVYLDLFSNGAFLLFFLILYLFGARLGGAALAFFLSSLLGFSASVYALVRLFPDFFAASSRSSLVVYELLAYSMPAFGASLFWVPRGWMDRILIGYFLRPTEVGLYQAASQSVSPLYMASFAVSSIAAPMIANLYNRGERTRLEDTFRVSSKWILYSTLFVFVAVAAGPRDVLKMFFGARYESAIEPLMILAIGAITDGTDGTARSMLLLTGNQKILLYIAAVGLILQFGFVPDSSVRHRGRSGGRSRGQHRAEYVDAARRQTPSQNVALRRTISERIAGNGCSRAGTIPHRNALDFGTDDPRGCSRFHCCRNLHRGHAGRRPRFRRSAGRGCGLGKILSAGSR